MAIFTLFWVVLFERTTPKVVLAAPIVAAASIILSEKYLLRDQFYDLYYFNVFWLIKYMVVLVGQIYISSFQLLPLIISGKARPVVVSITTEIEDSLNLAILCNSITLTPGTITIDVSGQLIMVLWLNPTTKEPTIAGKQIKGVFEDQIKEK